MMVTHPAKFSGSILDAIRGVLDERDFKGTILDPFAGVGGIHDLWTADRLTYSVELEPEWALQRAGYASLQGDATDLHFKDGVFDAVITSPPYGNRMADSYAGDGTRRHTYRIALDRPLTDGSLAAQHFGVGYCETAGNALVEIHRVLKPGGLFILNISNFIRGGVIEPVCDWYMTACESMGFVLEQEIPVATPRNRHGANGELRAQQEWVFVMVRP